MIFHRKASLQTLIERGDHEGLRARSREVVKRVNQGDENLIYHIGAHRDHAIGRIMFRVFKRACDEMSPHHWNKIMKVMGQPLMRGSVESQNIKLLEHAMSHVDEIYLKRLLCDVDTPEVLDWYNENFT
jgi:hypothetical protein